MWIDLATTDLEAIVQKTAFRNYSIQPDAG